MYVLDNKLQSLILKYRDSLGQLNQAKQKAQKVQSSEQILNKHSQESSLENNVINSAQLTDMVKKLKGDVDSLINRRQIEYDECQGNVQAYIDHSLWNLHCKTEIETDNYRTNKDSPERDEDKHRLLNMIHTLFQNEKNEDDDYRIHIHSWLSTTINIYLRLCTPEERHVILNMMMNTTDIYPWAIPLIQVNPDKHMSPAQVEDYVNVLIIIFQTPTNKWTEDDFFAVVDQLAIDMTYHHIIESVVEYSDQKMDYVFTISSRMTDVLMKGVENYSHMKSLLKRLSQVITQIIQILVDYLLDKEWLIYCQHKIDLFISGLVSQFMNIKTGNDHRMHGDGWYFLPNIPYKTVSVDTLWDITVDLLQLDEYNHKNRPMTLFIQLEDLPDLSRFQHSLTEHPTQAFFMLNCLSNIVTCIPSGVHDIKNTNNTTSTCIITLISYALFDIAFLHAPTKDIFHREVRDCFSAICHLHPFVISLLFRWSTHYLYDMDRMVLYLFHALPLSHWTILKDDLKLLHPLFTQSIGSYVPPKSTSELVFAKYIIQNLNYGYKPQGRDPTLSRSQPWSARRIPCLDYEIHEEIAFILLDACQSFQPLSDKYPIKAGEGKSGYELMDANPSSLASYLPIIDHISLLKTNYTASATYSPTDAVEFINWCWKIAQRLLLYDCPLSSRATEIQSSLHLSFLKAILNSTNDISSSHSTLLVYLSFMLSPTSRHFLRFDSGNGWMQLLTILKKGKPEAVVQILSQIIPSFVYMHGDDFFNNESLIDFLKQMIEFKPDPSLTKTGFMIMKEKSSSYMNQEYNAEHTTNGINMIIASNVWHASFIDSVSNLMDDKGKGFSYVDLVIHSWLKTVFMKSDWMWYDTYTSMIDFICKLSFSLGRHSLVQHMLIEEGKRMENAKNSLYPQQNTLNYNNAVMNSPRMLTRFIKNMMLTEGIYPTLLIGDWSLLNIKANTFNKSPGVENQLFWFAFQTLLTETIREASLREKLAQAIIRSASEKSAIDIHSISKSLASHTEKPLEFFTIYRWLQHIVVLPIHHVLLPLFLQAFFTLYFSSVTVVISKEERKVTLGSIFFNKKPELIHKLRDYIANAQTYYGQKITTSKDQYMPSIYTAPTHLELLQQTYYAMWLWLGNDALLGSQPIDTLPVNYDGKRLSQCMLEYNSKMLWDDPRLYWMDLVDIERLENDFINYPWEGSEKFRKRTDNDDRISVMSSSLSTASRRVKFITEESNILPLPKSEFREPQIDLNVL